MIAIIHNNWDSDIVLGEGDLEKLSKEETLHGEIYCYKEIGEISLSANNTEFSTGSYFKLDWNKNQPNKYSFKLSPSGMQLLMQKNYVHGRYEEGLNGSKLAIYGPGKDEMTEEMIKFSIDMVKLREKDNN